MSAASHTDTPDDVPDDDLPDIGEMVEVMREVVDADTALMTNITDEARSHGAFMENSKRLTAALNAQRALLARIDSLLSPEVSP
nr:hypothetical protein [Mesorhizobium sp.]